MPELPEVETIRRQLAPHLEGRTIVRAVIGDPRWTRPATPAEVEDGVAGRQIESLGRRGKYLIWSLAGDRHLLVHLRMTGALLYDPVQAASAASIGSSPGAELPGGSAIPHGRSWFELDDGHRVVYVDPRRFGTAHLLCGAAARDAYLDQRLGAEPLTPEFTVQYLRAAARGVRAPIKAFVLDQRRIAGVGNIYADEALHRAGIHPLRPAGRLTTAQFAVLRDAIEDALRAGIEAKGATIDDFRHIDGATGSFQDLFLVHRREGEACLTCATVVRKLVVGGRGTYVCEFCQLRPRRRRAGTLSPKRPRAGG
ncbi:MAG: bifunctional DNA-formamidopyrimidine glycosylase/DNA-(apurinic or apyrimidinic site) lyase [Actinomycetota bacterium]|nr:bifunctional DNA-formamidopyrimidine glycosylase/DNA-(apurinic or apyrimidinic site) lyase [Actinomycetota bacterium]